MSRAWVMPGETPITVQGADQLGDNGQASSQDGSADGAQSDDAAGSGDTASSGGAADSADEGSGGERRIPRPANRPHLRRLSGRSAKFTQIPPGTTRCWTPYSSILAQRTRL